MWYHRTINVLTVHHSTISSSLCQSRVADAAGPTRTDWLEPRHLNQSKIVAILGNQPLASPRETKKDRRAVRLQLPTILQSSAAGLPPPSTSLLRQGDTRTDRRTHIIHSAINSALDYTSVRIPLHFPHPTCPILHRMDISNAS